MHLVGSVRLSVRLFILHFVAQHSLPLHPLSYFAFLCNIDFGVTSGGVFFSVLD